MAVVWQELSNFLSKALGEKNSDTRTSILWNKSLSTWFQGIIVSTQLWVMQTYKLWPFQSWYCKKAGSMWSMSGRISYWRNQEPQCATNIEKWYPGSVTILYIFVHATIYERLCFCNNTLLFFWRQCKLHLHVQNLIEWLLGHWYAVAKVLWVAFSSFLFMVCGCYRALRGILRDILRDIRLLGCFEWLLTG